MVSPRFLNSTLSYGNIELDKITITKNEHFCPSRDFARQASAQTMCVSSEWSSLVSFDPIVRDFPLLSINRLIP